MVLSKIQTYKMQVETVFLLVVCLRMVSVFLVTTMFAPFQKSIGISLEQMAILEALFWVVMLVMEVPTGIIADKRGRAWAVKTGSLLFTLGIFTYSIACNFYSALTSESLIATGIAFMSGAEDAWITDALVREGKDTLKHVQANTAKWNAIIAVAGGVSGAYIANYLGYRMVWVIGGFSVALSFVIASWQMNGQGEVIHETQEAPQEKSMWSTTKQSIRIWIKTWSLIWISLICGVFSLGFAFNHYWPIYFGGYPEAKDHLGIVWAVIFPAFMIGPWALKRYYDHQYKMRKKAGHETLFILLSLLLTGIGLAGAGYSGNLASAGLFCVVHELGRGLFRPVMKPYIHERIQSEYRATYDSLQNMLNSGFIACCYLAFSSVFWGRPPTASSVGYLWTLSGSALVLFTLVLFLIRPRKR